MKRFLEEEREEGKKGSVCHPSEKSEWGSVHIKKSDRG